MSTDPTHTQTETVTGALPPDAFDAANVKTYGPLQVFAVHEPEILTDAQGRPVSPRAAGYDVNDPHTGFVTIYVELEGVKVPIERRKAAGVLADIAAARQAAPAEPEPEPTPAQTPQV